MAEIPPINPIDSPIPCYECGAEVPLATTRCPKCSKDLLVVVCPDCLSIIPRISRSCLNCARNMPVAYSNLTDLETRDLFGSELAIQINADNQQLPAAQREYLNNMHRLRKRYLLREITEAQYNQGMTGELDNMLRLRAK